MIRTALSTIGATALAVFGGCTSFDAPASSGSSSSDAGANEAAAGDAAAAGGFCASRRDYDVCSDFDASNTNPIEGWDAFNGSTGAEPKIDSSDARSDPSSLRFDLAGTGYSDLGLVKTIGAGTVYHVEAAVRFDRKVQTDYVDIARLEITTPSGNFVTQIDMQPEGMHFGFCPEDTASCVYGNPPHDLQAWRTLAFDLDASQGTAKLTIGDVVEERLNFPAKAIEKVTVTIGPRQVAQGNTLVVRYDDVLIWHR